MLKRRRKVESSAFAIRTPEECAHCIVWLRIYANMRRAPFSYAIDPKFYHKAKMTRIEFEGTEEQVAWKKEGLEKLVGAQGWKRRDGGEGIVFAQGMRIEEFVSYYIIPGAEVQKSQL